MQEFPSHCDYLIVGCESLLGKKFWERLISIPNKKTIGTSHKNTANFLPLNLLDKFYRVPKPKNGGKAFIFAAKSNHTFCEEFPELTYKINVNRTIALTEYLNSIGWSTIHFSSTQVFSSNKPWMQIFDPQDPISEFGKQKTILEQMIWDLPKNIIIRVTKVLNLNDNPFEGWINDLKNSHKVYPFINYPISPISLTSFITATLEIASKYDNGIFHLGNLEQTDYAEVCYLLAAKLKLDSALIEPRLPDPLKLKYIPKYSSLNLGLTMDKLDWVAENLEKSINNAVTEYLVD